MRLSLKQLRAAGFRSIRQPIEIDFEARGPGLHFVKGRNERTPSLQSNGSGKSSIWGAVSWCWYGRTPAGLRTPDIKPWQGDATADVTTVINLDDRAATIRRSADPSRLEIDGKATDQQHVDDLLQMPFDVFCHAVLLGQDEDLFFDIPPREKMSLFSTVLNLDRWTVRAKQAADLATKLDRQATSLTAQIEAKTAAADRLEKTITTLTEQMDEWAASAKTRRSEIEASLAQKQKELDKIAPEHDKLSLRYDAALTEMRPLEQEMSKTISDLRAVDRNVIEFEAVVMRAQEDRNEMKAQLAELKVAKTCPTCGQKITQANLANHKLEVERRLAASEQIIKAGVPPATTKKKAALSKLLAAQTAALAHFKEAVAEVQDRLPALSERRGALEAETAAQRQQLAVLAEEVNPYRQQLHSARREQSALDDEADKLKADLTAVQADAVYAQQWEKGFKAIQLRATDEALEELELTTNNWLVEAGLVDWQVRFDIERETKAGTISSGLTVSILSPDNNHLVRWESWSGGEAQRLRIIGALAFADVLLARAGVESTLLILDEPMKFVTDQGVRDIIDFCIDYAAKSDKQVWYCDHVSMNTTGFASVLSVVKDKDGTYVEE